LRFRVGCDPVFGQASVKQLGGDYRHRFAGLDGLEVEAEKDRRRNGQLAAGLSGETFGSPMRRSFQEAL
jgi:hypothetical protein